MIYSMNELRRCFEAGYPFALLEHLHEILERKKPPPLTETPQTRKIEGAEFKSDVTKKQKPFYTREQIIEESIPTENTGEEIKIGEDKGKTIDVMV